MKHEWRKKEKGIYFPGNNPERITVPSFKFFMIEGKGNKLSRESKQHREIYLSDVRKVSPEKLKTVLRFKVKK